MSAPRPSPARGPSDDITPPTIGPPIGVEPWKATNHSAITRPRICGSARSCSVALPADMKMTDAAPTSASASSSSAMSGAKVAIAMANPNASAPMIRTRAPILPRLAMVSPPATAPTPIAAVMKP